MGVCCGTPPPSFGTGRETAARRFLRIPAQTLLQHNCLSGAEVEAVVRDCGVTCERAELPLGWNDWDEETEGEAFSESRW